MAEHIHIIACAGGAVGPGSDRFHHRLTVDHDDISTTPFCVARKPRDQGRRDMGEFHPDEQVHVVTLRRIPDLAHRLHQVREV